MRQKRPLKINHYEADGGELERLTEEAKKLIRSTYQGRLKDVFEAAAESLAALALYPEMMGQDCAEMKDFGCCYGRYPDTADAKLTLWLLTELRKASERIRREESGHRSKRLKTKSGRVEQFFLTTKWLVKKGGKFVREDTLNRADYLPAQRHAIEDLQDGEVAQFLTDECVRHKKSIVEQIETVGVQLTIEREITKDQRQVSALEARMEQLKTSLDEMTDEDFSADDVRIQRQKMASSRRAQKKKTSTKGR